MKVFLARHGQTFWNREKKLQGWLDTPLSPTGWHQAVRLSQRLFKENIAHIYTSLLTRSISTAKFFPSHIPRTSLLGLNERRYGEFTGSQFISNSKLEVKLFKKRSLIINDDLNGGETIAQFHWRVSQAFFKIIKIHFKKNLDPKNQGRILFITHGGTNGQLIRLLEQLPFDYGEKVRQRNETIYQTIIHEDWIKDTEKRINAKLNNTQELLPLAPCTMNTFTTGAHFDFFKNKQNVPFAQRHSLVHKAISKNK